MNNNSLVFIDQASPMSWVKNIATAINLHENNIVIAPRRTGKTTFIRKLVTRLLCTKPSLQNKKFFIISPNRESLKMIKKTMEEVLLTKVITTSYIELISGATIYFKVIDENPNRMLCGVKCEHIFIDDADMIESETLYNTFLAAACAESSFTAIGSDNKKERGNKNIWKWMINHPTFNVFEVYMSDAEERKLILDTVKCLGERLAKKILMHEYLIDEEKIDEVMKE